MKSVLLLVLSLFVFQNVDAQGVRFVHGTFDEVLSLAQKEKKLVFIDAYTVWCGPCKAMTKNVFPKKNVGDYFNTHFVSIKIDMEKGIGRELGLKYNVKAFPTMLFIDSEGTLVHKVAGYQSTNNLIKQGKVAMNPKSSFMAMKERYDIGDHDPAFLLKYLELCYNMADGSHGAVAEAYLDTQKDWNTPKALKTIYKYTSSADSKMFKYMVEHKAVFYQKFGSSKVGRKIQTLLEKKLSDPNTNLEDIQDIYRKAYSGREGEEKASKIRLTYYRRKGDRKAYANSAFDHYKKYPTKNPEELNEVGMTFVDAVNKRKLLKKAAKLVKKSIKMDDAYYNNYTLARLYAKLKKRRRAKKCAKVAIARAKAQGDDYSDAEDLLKQLQKKK